MSLLTKPVDNLVNAFHSFVLFSLFEMMLEDRNEILMNFMIFETYFFK